MAKRKIKSVTDQRPFIMIYQDFLESDLLDSHYQKLVYVYLKKFSDSNNQCFPSIKTLAKLTKISEKKVKITLDELEQKGVIFKENRSRADGGKTSNLYTLYDFAEVWNVGNGENVAAVAEEVAEAKMIAELRKKGYVVTKEKEPEASQADQSNDESSTNNLNHFYKNNTPNLESSQDRKERYTLTEIRTLYEYDIMLADEPMKKNDIDSVIQIIYETLNTTKEKIRIGGEDKPAMAVIGKLMKLERPEILYSVEKFSQQTERIKNPTAYMLTLLYYAKEQMNLDVTNRVAHDMAHWNP